MAKLNPQELESKLFSELNRSIVALVFVLDSRDRRIEDLYKIKYSDKDSMKHLGVMLWGFEGKMIELVILGLAKAIEDLIGTIAQETGDFFSIWKDLDDLAYVQEAKRIRRLANTIKHHTSTISRGRHKDSNDLINVDGFKDGFEIGKWKEDDIPSGCLYRNAYYTFQFGLQLIGRISGKPYSIEEFEGDVKENIRVHFLGEILEMEKI